MRPDQLDGAVHVLRGFRMEADDRGAGLLNLAAQREDLLELLEAKA